MLKNQSRNSPEGIMSAMTSSSGLGPKNIMSKRGRGESKTMMQREQHLTSGERCPTPPPFVTLKPSCFLSFHPALISLKSTLWSHLILTAFTLLQRMLLNGSLLSLSRLVLNSWVKSPPLPQPGSWEHRPVTRKTFVF